MRRVRAWMWRTAYGRFFNISLIQKSFCAVSAFFVCACRSIMPIFLYTARDSPKIAIPMVIITQYYTYRPGASHNIASYTFAPLPPPPLLPGQVRFLSAATEAYNDWMDADAYTLSLVPGQFFLCSKCCTFLFASLFLSTRVHRRC